MRFFFSLFMFVYLGASVIVILHMLDVLRPFKIRWAIMAIYIFVSFSMMIGRGFAQYLPLEVSAFETRLGYMWISLLTFTFIWSIVFLVLRLFHIGPVSEQSRIIFYLCEVGLCVILLLIGYYNAYNVHIVKHDIDTGKNINLRAVQITDMHLGFMNNEKRFSRIVDQIEQINPDIVFITGDFLENEHNYAVIKDIGAPLHRLNPVYGIWGVVGNHEYIAGIDRSLAYMSDLGINILRDSTVVIDNNILIIGQEDSSMARRRNIQLKTLDELKDNEIKPESTVRDLMPQKLTIVLSHYIKDHTIYEHQGFDLVLSGHTHDGQFFPWNLVTRRLNCISYGLERKGDSHFYVSSGTGIWGPAFRLGTKSEIVVFDIK